MRRFTLILILLGLVMLPLAAQKSLQLSSNPTAVQLQRETKDGLSVRYSIAKIDYDEVDTPEGRFTDVFIEQYATTSEVGLPKLPLMRQIIAVPEGANVVARFTSQERQSISLASKGIHYPIVPRQAPVAKNQDLSTLPFVVDREVYNLSAWTAGTSVTATELGYMRGVRMFAVDFMPIRYNPALGMMEVITEAEIKVDFIGSDHAATEALRAKTYSPAFAPVYSNTLLNSTSTRATLNRVPMSYVIITPASFVTALQPFIDWKKVEGFNVIVATTDQTGTTPAAIKSYLQNLWDSATVENPAPSYLHIVGDVAQVPTNQGSTGNHVTDLTYVRLQGNDYLPEMYFSRFSATTPAEVTNQVNKTLMHEMYTMPDDSYLTDSVLIAGVDSYWSPSHANGQINYATTNYFNAAHNINAITYLYPQSGSSAAQIVQNVSNGVGYVTYTAHGSEYSWADPSFTIGNINNLQNFNEYPVVIGNCCITNAFQLGICFGEAWLRAENRGAVIYVGGTNNTYWDEDYWWSVGYKPPAVGGGSPFVPGRTGYVDAIFHEHNEPYEDWVNQMGAGIFMGNMAVVQSNSSRANYYWEVYSIMGDASLIPYMGIPVENSAQAPEIMHLGLDTLEMTADPYSHVALSMNGVLHGVGMADANGNVNLTYTPFDEPGTAKLVITRSLRKPMIEDIQVLPNTGAYVIVSPITVNNPSGSGLAEAGDTVSFNLSLNNVGVLDATNLSLTLSSDSPWVNILEAQATVADVASGATVEVNDVFSVLISPVVPDQEVIAFDISVTDGTDTWTSRRSITAYAANVQISQSTVTDGDGDGFYEPGETITIQLDLINQGHLATDGGQVLAFTNHPGFVLTSNQMDLPALAIGASTQVIIIGYMAADIELGDVVTVGLAIEAGTQLLNHSITLPVGVHGEGFESGDLNSFPWVNNSPVPWTLVSGAPNVHSGQYALKSGAIGNNTSTEVMVTMYCASPGVIRFWRKVSSEAGYDKLIFSINGTEKGSYSGNQDWAEMSFDVEAGTNTFNWKYQKDYSVSTGGDCAWIDDIVFPFTNSTDAAVFYTPVEEILFSDARPGQVLSQDITIRNLGNIPMSGTITIPEAFTLYLGSNALPDDYYYTIDAVSNAVFRLEYVVPDPAENFNGVIIISSNDLSNPAVMIDLAVIPYVSNDDPATPITTMLQGNYPNPFNPETVIRFATRDSGNVKITVYNIKGQVVKTLTNKNYPSGNHQLIWNGKDDKGRSVSSGIYMYRMETPSYTKTMKMMLMK